MREDISEEDVHRWFGGLLAMRALPSEVRMLAHRFNNQLTVMSAHLSLLRELVSGAEESESIQAMDQTVEGLAATMATVRDLACPSPARSTRPDEVLRDFREAVMRMDVGGADLEVAPGPAGLALGVNAGMVMHLLHELVGNALAATGGGPEARIRVGAEARADGIAFVVEDNGPGLDPEIAARLGRPFVTTRAGAAGLGLCLAMAQLAPYRARLEWGASALGGARFAAIFPA